MTPSQKCINLIEDSEGFSTKPYKCPAGVWTIGFGSTCYENGMPVHETDIAIDEKRAISIMQSRLKSYAADVTRYVKVPINQNQFDALVDFAYNIGSKNLLNSTLLKRINANEFLGASREFRKWVYADGKILKGLIARREAERVLFCTMQT